VHNYALIAKPKKGLLWTDQATQAFHKLKLTMMRTPVLALSDFNKSFSTETDPCNTGIGAVLMQDKHPTHLSKALE
jgi:hypothetical protein